jgi:putative PEP-CTERM system integral membrane protein
MQKSVSEVEDALNYLASLEQNGAYVDVYLTSSIFRGEPASQTSIEQARNQEMIYFGGQNAAELLAQYTDLSQDKQYDAILILTDGSGYELGPSEAPVSVPDAPLWLVHINNEYTLGYDDTTLEAIQASGGGVAGSLDEALSRIAVGLSGGETLTAQLGLPAGNSQMDVVDGYAWLTYPTGSEGIDVLASTGSDDFGAFAARRVILAEMQRNRGDLSNLAILDTLHAIAVEHQVVTPYSSMIVLVNAQQRRNLEMLEGQADRFAREFEGSGDTVPQSFSVTGVPEPEEWLLLALVAGLLGWYYRKSLKEKLNFSGHNRIGLG